MSLPPQLIRIKRKAADESPVSFLRVQESKRHRSDQFVYQRQERDAALAEEHASLQRPIIHTYQRRTQSAPQQSSPKRDKDSSASAPLAPNDDQDEDVTKSSVPAEPRQFHMSRQDMQRTTSSTLNRARGGVTKKRQAPTMFVERKIKQVSAKKLDRLRANADITDISSTTHLEAPTTDGMEVDSITPRKYKKPGVAKLANSKDQSQVTKQIEPSQAITERWRDIDLAQLSAEMNAYTLEQIGLNIKQADEEEQRRRDATKRNQPTSPSQLKYKPKAPAQRYADRHTQPEETVPDKEMADVDGHMSDYSDDADYIIETYVRVPASRIGDHVPPQNVGVLVFDGEPEIEYFYGDASDSEDEWAEDEEDENAENYYTADYPDDEVASDDEYGQNPYAYRTGNASDLEEYDANSDDDIQWSGDENDVEGRFAKFKANYSSTRDL